MLETIFLFKKNNMEKVPKLHPGRKWKWKAEAITPNRNYAKLRMLILNNIP